MGPLKILGTYCYFLDDFESFDEDFSAPFFVSFSEDSFFVDAFDAPDLPEVAII